MAENAYDNHYATLGIPYDASSEEIRRAFHAAAKRFHPDANPADDAPEQFLKVKQAFDILSDPARRSVYDSSFSEIHSEQILRVRPQLSRQRLIQTADPQILYLMLHVEVDPDLPLPPEMPVHACLVIDASTSMQGIRMDRVKAAVNRILQTLKPADSISIVSFNDRAEVVLEPEYPGDLRRIEARVNLIQAGGGTEMASGLKEGYRLISRPLARVSATRRMILITDGNTYGDESECLAIADRCGEEGITISALGIGEDWKESFVEDLAARTGGSSVYAATAGDVARFLTNEFSGLQQVAADRLRLSLESIGVETRILDAFRSRPDPASLGRVPPIPVGSLRQGENLVCLVEIQVESAAGDAYSGMELRGELVYEVPGREIPTSRLQFAFPLVAAAGMSAEDAPQELRDAVRRWTMYRLQEKARREVEQGQIEAATRRLRRLATNLLASGENQLASTVLTEAARLEDGKAEGAKLGKSIMYGTKNLGLKMPKDEA